MAELEKVIKGLECCFRGNDCRNCPYKEVFNPERPDLDCIDTTREDAIALLKEYQEKQKGLPPAWQDRTQEHICQKCGGTVWQEDNYCSKCGQKVKWNG